MLSLKDRSIYLNELRPPQGYVLDRALATTFSLDLLSLLMAPLSMVFFEAESSADAMKEPTAILEALRRVTGRVAVFCQQGRIAVPGTSSLLFSYLESMVIEVRPQSDAGVFHPKIWLLRFVGEGGDVIYRLLCLSRNLTFDKSWDTVLCMEGPVLNRRNGISRNRPLADFVRSLPGLAVREAGAGIQDIVNLVAGEVSRVRFEAPPEFEKDYTFVPMGIPRHRRGLSLGGFRRLLVLSPFLSEDGLKALSTGEHQNVLISRAESLDGIQDDLLEAVSSRTAIYAIDDRAERPEESDDDSDTGQDYAGTDLSGLHAKMYIMEDGWNARLLTGSANATAAAIGGKNVEFMVELAGRRSVMGIDRFLGSDSDVNAFKNLLVPYVRGSDRADVDLVRESLEKTLDAARQAIALADLSLDVGVAGPDLYSMRLTASAPLDLGQACPQADCFPITMGGTAAQVLSPLSDGKPVVFPGVSMATLTGFVAFRLKAMLEGQTMAASFVMNLPVRGMPEERDRRILEAVISDTGGFLRYLLFLMADGEDALASALWLARGDNLRGGDPRRAGHAIPLLEELVRMFSRNPERLDRIAQLVNDLRQSEAGRSIMPEGFERIWDALAAARRRGVSR